MQPYVDGYRMKTYTEPPLPIADLEAAPDDGNRYELIEGELHVSTAPTPFHQRVSVRLTQAFGRHLDAHPIGEIFHGAGIVFDDFNGVIPDLLFATHDRIQQAEVDGRLTSAPEIVMEILSPGIANQRRDRDLKRDRSGGSRD